MNSKHSMKSEQSEIAAQEQAQAQAHERAGERAPERVQEHAPVQAQIQGTMLINSAQAHGHHHHRNGHGGCLEADAQLIAENPYKKRFPLLVANPHLAFLDSAATAQRPDCVLAAQRHFYESMNANPLRGLYDLSIKATQAIEDARAHVARFIGVAPSASSENATDEKRDGFNGSDGTATSGTSGTFDTSNAAQEIIFGRNASEMLNLLAYCYGELVLHKNDEVCISIMEHHSNLIPWQQVCRKTGARLVYMRPDEHGVITQAEAQRCINERTKIVSVTHVSNVLGSCNDIKMLASLAHAVGARIIVDGSQSIPHMPIRVRQLDCDFFVFSGHKLFSPLGVGVLWGKRQLLEAMPPFLTGGEMIDSVTETSATWAPLPEKFEAGTQDAAGIYALSSALNFVEEIGYAAMMKRERALVHYTWHALKHLPYVQLIGSPCGREHHGVISFNVQGIHPHDVSSILDMNNVAIRAGHHCAQPLLTWMGIESCCRASFAFYNDKSDCDALITGLQRVWETFNGN